MPEEFHGSAQKVRCKCFSIIKIDQLNDQRKDFRRLFHGT